MKKGYLLTEKQAIDIFLVLSNARLKCTGKFKTSAEKYWKEFEKEIIPIMTKLDLKDSDCVVK